MIRKPAKTKFALSVSREMYWTVHLEGGPRRVNHAAAPVDDLIYSFGGYNTGENYYEYRAMDVHVLSTGWFLYFIKFSLCCCTFDKVQFFLFYLTALKTLLS